MIKDFSDVVLSAMDVLHPPERITVSQCAEKYRYINNTGAYIGHWKNDTAPYLTEVMDSLNSRKYKSVVFAAPAQSGKTDLGLNWLAYSVIADPMDMILYQTSMAVARDFSRRRVDRLHRHSKSVGSRVMTQRGSDNTMDKFYKSGMMFTLSYPSVNELAGRPVGRVWISDYDRMEDDVGGEGSVYDLARKRTTTFGSQAMTFVESSPSKPVRDDIVWSQTSPHEAPPASGILSIYNRGTMCRRYWPCPHCIEWFEPSFDLLNYNPELDPVEAGKNAMLECPHCHALIEPDMKNALDRKGVWLGDGQKIVGGKVVGKLKDTDIASFWLKGVVAAFVSWQDLVVKYMQALQEYKQTGNDGALRSTVNVDQAEPYIPKGLLAADTWETYKDRSIEIADEPSVPQEARCLFATADTQANRWEVSVQAILPPVTQGGMYNTIVIDRFAIIKSNRLDDDGERLWVKPASISEDWDLLISQVLEKNYPIVGTKSRMGIKITSCDSAGGGKKGEGGVTTQAYTFYNRLKKTGLHGRLILTKGTANVSAPSVQITYPDASIKGKTAIARGDIPVMMIQTDKMKDQISGQLANDGSDSGCIDFWDGLPDEVYHELTAESRDGRGKWQNKRRLRNEQLDLLVQNAALAKHLRLEHLDWDKTSWLKPWNENSLVIHGEEDKKVDVPKKVDLNTLGALLA